MKFAKICKYTVIAILLIFIAFLAVRIFMSSDRGTLDDIYPTNAAVSGYEKSGKDAFMTAKLPHDMSEDGYFIAYAPVYCKSEKEFQITVRYNDSLSENYLPGSDPEKYYFELRDSDGNTVSKATVVDEKELYFYNHFRLAFDGVEIDSESELYIFLCSDESSYPAEHTKGIMIAHPSITYRTASISRSEKNSLSEKAE